MKIKTIDSLGQTFKICQKLNTFVIVNEHKYEKPSNRLSDFLNTYQNIIDITDIDSIDFSKYDNDFVIIDLIERDIDIIRHRTIVQELLEKQYNIQFLITTQSPLVVQSIDSGLLFRLGYGIEELEYQDHRSVEDILETVFRIQNTTRSIKYLSMIDAAKKYYDILKNAKNATDEEKEKLKVMLDQAIEPYSSNVAYTTFLKMERLSHGL